MELKEIKKEELSLEYEAFIAAEELNNLKITKLQAIAVKAKLSGFRPGKAPLDLIEKQYKTQVMSELQDESISNALDTLYKEKKLVTISSPSIEIKEFSLEKGLTIKIMMDLFPKIEHLNFADITIEKPVLEVSEEDINMAMNQMANYHKSFTDITKDKAIENNDVAVIDFLGKLDSIEFEGGKGEDFPLEIGSNMFIPGFEEQLLNKKVNDNVEVKVKFPDDYHAKNLAGKDVVFEVLIKKLQKPATPKIDDEFAKKVGFDNLKSLKENIKQKYQAHFLPMQRMEMKKQIIEKLKATKDFEISEKLLKSELDYLWKDFTTLQDSVKNAKESGKIDSYSQEEQELANTSDEDMKIKHLAEAKARIKIALILNDLSTKNNIVVTEKDVSELLADEALRSGREPEAIMSYYKNNQQALKQLQNKALEEKIMSFLFSKVKVIEKVSTFEAFNKKLQG